MTCRLVTILTSEPSEDSVGSSMHVSGKSFVDSKHLQTTCKFCRYILLAEAYLLMYQHFFTIVQTISKLKPNCSCWGIWSSADCCELNCESSNNSHWVRSTQTQACSDPGERHNLDCGCMLGAISSVLSCSPS